MPSACKGASEVEFNLGFPRVVFGKCWVYLVACGTTVGTLDVYFCKWLWRLILHQTQTKYGNYMSWCLHCLNSLSWDFLTLLSSRNQQVLTKEKSSPSNYLYMLTKAIESFKNNILISCFLDSVQTRPLNLQSTWALVKILKMSLESKIGNSFGQDWLRLIFCEVNIKANSKILVSVFS